MAIGIRGVVIGASTAGGPIARRPTSDVNRVRTTAPPGRPGGAVAYPGDLPRAPLPAATTAGQGAVK